MSSLNNDSRTLLVCYIQIYPFLCLPDTHYHRNHREYHHCNILLTKSTNFGSPYHFMTIQLAVVDLWICAYVVLGLYLPDNVVEPGTLSTWPSHIRMSLSSVSCWALTMLSFDWYRGITNPFKKALRKKKHLYGLLISMGDICRYAKQQISQS